MGFYCVPSQSSLRERERERERERGFVDEQYLNGVIEVLLLKKNKKRELLRYCLFVICEC